MSVRRFTPTPSQQDAMDVSRRCEDACIVAGPGSGKTTVLVEYFRRLVAGEGLDPLRILAITFTEKAARQMREKLIAAFAGDRPIRARLERAWISTVHSFCARLLRENAVFAGLDPEFTVLDERESRRLQEDTLDGAFEALFAESPEMIRGLLRALAGGAPEEHLLAVYDAVRAAGQRVEDLDQAVPPEGVTPACIGAEVEALCRVPVTGFSAAQSEYLARVVADARAIAEGRGTALERLRDVCGFTANLSKLKRGHPVTEAVRQLRERIGELRAPLVTEIYEDRRWALIDVLARFGREYRSRKRRLGALDFTDLEEHTIRLLEENADVCARLQAQFDQVMMDEFQDTNPQQERLIALLRPPGRFYAVGDWNQSIYGFRHADPRVFERYSARVIEQGGHYVDLADNFRSRAQILSAVETLLTGEPGIRSRVLVARRVFEPRAEPSVELIAAPLLEVEARWVAHRAAELSAIYALRDMAVLVRNTEVLAEFTRAFDEAGIPHLVNRGRGFYETREVVDLIHLLRVIANPRDEISLAAVLRSPFVDASGEALMRLRRLGDNLGASLVLLKPGDEAAFAPEDWLRLRRFARRLARWRAGRHLVSFDRLLMEAIDECGYRGESGARGAANIEKFLAQARDASDGRSIEDFVEDLRRVRESNPREPDAPPEEAANAVQVMTVHAAKGLEFPVVFVAAMHKGTNNDPGTVAFLPEIGVGARWRNPLNGESLEDAYMRAIREERTRREEEEANRLLYVAMTRAEDRLVLSFSNGKGQPRNWAGLVCRRLGLDTGAVGERTLSLAAPDGKSWDLRLCVVAEPPPVARPEVAALETDVLELDRCRPAGQQDTNATVTALAAFSTCPRKYYLGHYLGLEGRALPGGETRQGPSASELGTQVHALLAGQEVEDADARARRMAEDFRRGALGRRVAHAARVEREYEFLLAVEDLVIRGQIDLWFEDAGGIVIVDYKTDAVDAGEAPRRAAEYALQLRLYAMAVERITGRAPSAAYVHFLRPDVAVPVDLSPTLLDGPEQIIRDFLEAQSSLRFPLRESEACRRCPFHRDLCPSQIP